MVDAAPHGEHRIAGPRLIAIVGPFQTGKTSLLEGLLARGGGVARQGSVREGTCVGDFGQEARAHQMSVEPNIAHVDYMGDRLTFFDCPGSVEFSDAARAALPVCDAAVVVCEADPRKVQALRVILRELEERKIPRFLFLNKIDLAGGGVREALETLQPASSLSFSHCYLRDPFRPALLEARDDEAFHLELLDQDPAQQTRPGPRAQVVLRSVTPKRGERIQQRENRVTMARPTLS